MCKRFDDWSKEIENFCNTNGFDFEKAKKLSKCWGKNDLILQYYDPEKGKLGLLDETPMPVVLWIIKNGDKLEFKQTEYTKKYLAQ
ncbi:MAG: hypothetical protein ACI4GY_07020 [Acutalibacteraceae bacterium]